jgi:hypothetical protein
LIYFSIIFFIYHESEYIKKETIMKKRTLMWSGVLLAALLLVCTILCGCTNSTESVSPAPNTAACPVAASSFSGGAPQEGIKVHGHWTIEVRNPDGTLAERREFENYLYPPAGGQALASFLSRQASVGGWCIEMWASNSNESAFKPNNVCIIAEPAFPYNSQSYFKNLTVSSRHDVSDIEDAYKLVLSGTATALSDGKINWVSTAATLLSASIPPSGAYSSTLYPFTQQDLVSAVNLSTGQQITVTVVISFS